MTVLSGPSFITLTVENMELSRQFYKDKIGFHEFPEKVSAAPDLDPKPSDEALRHAQPESLPSASPGLGLQVSTDKRPTSQTFDTKPCGIEIRQAEPESPKSASPGHGILIWLHTANSKAMHDKLKEEGVDIVRKLGDGPFGKTFSFKDPDGYIIAVYEGG